MDSWTDFEARIAPRRPFFESYPALLLASVLLLVVAIGTASAAMVRFGMIQPLLPLLWEDMRVGEVRILSWILAPVLGSETRLSELAAAGITGFVVGFETYFFHVLWQLRERFVAMRELAQQAELGLVDSAEGVTPEQARATLRMLRLGRRDQVVRTVAWALVLGGLLVPVLMADWWLAAMRVVVNQAQGEADQALSMMGDVVTLKQLPALGPLVHPEAHGEVVSSAFPEGIRMSAWIEVIGYGVIPALLLSVALTFWTRQARRAGRSTIDGVYGWYRRIAGVRPQAAAPVEPAHAAPESTPVPVPPEPVVLDEPGFPTLDPVPAWTEPELPPWSTPEATEPGVAEPAPQPIASDAGYLFLSCGCIVGADEAGVHGCNQSQSEPP